MLSVLIVDDEAYVCDGIAQNIPWSQFGIGSVLKARTGKEGLAVAEKMRPDIVISDVRHAPHERARYGFRLAVHPSENSIHFYERVLRARIL